MIAQGAVTAYKTPMVSNLTTSLKMVGEGVAELLWPTRCVLCDVPGILLCHECMLELPYIDPLRACPNCGQAHGKLACTACNSFIAQSRAIGASSMPLDDITSVVEFEGPVTKLVTVYKDKQELRLGAALAELLSCHINPSWIAPHDTAIVAIPARKQAISQRGFDHMKEVGEHLARLCGLAHLELLVPLERGDQRGLSAAGRQKNMQGSFAPRAQWMRPPSNVILIDDVFTTGATLMAGAAVLKEMGAKQVFGLTFGRVP